MRRNGPRISFIAGLVLTAILGLSLKTDVRAQGPHVDLALVLAIDCSFSVDANEFRLQMQGLGSAFLQPDIKKAITGGDRIAVWLGGLWIEGSVEHAGTLYASEASGRAERGYYFIARNGGVCGLCAGMHVRLI